MGRRPRSRARVTPAKRLQVMPWIASVFLHLGLVILGLMVTWSVIESSDREPLRPVIADFEAAAFMDLADPPLRETETSRPPAPTAPPLPPMPAIGIPLASLATSVPELMPAVDA